MSHFLQNLNGNMLCAVDVETTGLDPEKHDIVQIAVIPLGVDLKAMRTILPFIMEMKPIHDPAHISSEAMRINRLKLCEIATRGMDPNDGSERFMEWYQKLNLGPMSKIMPLACNWPFDRSFIFQWLGMMSFEMCFSPIYRDIMAMALFLNDRAGLKGMDFPYAFQNLQFLCTRMGIERSRAHDAVSDAWDTVKVYHRLVKDAM